MLLQLFRVKASDINFFFCGSHAAKVLIKKNLFKYILFGFKNNNQKLSVSSFRIGVFQNEQYYHN
jgi:hypothetical protein